MSDMVVRIGVVLLIIVVAVAVAYLIGRVKRPRHPNVTVGDAGDRPGVLIFTSTDCSTCKDTIALLRDIGAPFREITNELEPHRFEDWDVVAVPLTVIVDETGNVVRTFSGIPSRRILDRTIASAGIATS
ncbi:MAG: TlpA family protein disulfide reductase [Acidimicrobiia bacterium]